jgi:dTDP-4-amino-4,6-dideoxygalactose transaminase
MGDRYLPVSGKVVGKPEKDMLREAVEEGWFTEGHFTTEFERRLAEWVGARSASFCNSGSSANLLAVLTLKEMFAKGDRTEVVTPACGFPTTLNPILQAGLKPVFVDVTLGTYVPDIEEVLEAITPRTAFVVLPHTLGNPSPVHQVAKACANWDMGLLEDNCLSKETAFITDRGVRCFADFQNGAQTRVLTRTGAWSVARVRAFGKRRLQRVILQRHGNRKVVRATVEHKWLLADGRETTSIRVGDRLVDAPCCAQFDYDRATWIHKEYWARGFVWGDGTRMLKKDGTQGTRVVLFGDKRRYEKRFVEHGFLSRKASRGAKFTFVDLRIWQTWKTLPVPGTEPSLIAAFVHGYLAADGTKDRRCPSRHFRIQATGAESISFIREMFPVAGYYILSEAPVDQASGYGRSAQTVRFQLTDGRRHRTSKWRVVGVEPDGAEDVWCLEVAKERNFLLPCGIVTGNCDALGSLLDGKKTGTFGELATQSFYPAHHITTGEGGMVIINRAKLKPVVESYRDWGRACAIAGTPVLTNRGVLPIESVRRGDAVLNAKGRFAKVTGLTGIEHSPILKVKVGLRPPVMVSPGHIFLTESRRERAWKRAAKLKVGDMVVERLPEMVANPEPMSFSYKNAYKERRFSVEHSTSIWRLIGYYAADGSLASGSKGIYPNGGRYKGYRVDFSLGSKKEEVIQDCIALMLECFGSRGWRRAGCGAVQVSFKSRRAYEFFRSVVGTHAPEKALPASFVHLPNELLLAFLGGYWACDGHMRRGQLSSTTTSPTLHEQVRLALLRLGVLASDSKRNSDKHHSSIAKGRKIEARHTLFGLSVYGNARLASAPCLASRPILLVGKTEEGPSAARWRPTQ